MTYLDPGEGPANPYAAPGADFHVPAPTGAGEHELADRGTRFAAAMLDSAVSLLIVVPLMIGAWPTIMSSIKAGKQLSYVWWVGTEPLQIVGAVALVALVTFQAYLVTTTGQSIGKRICNIRIVRIDDGPAGFVHGVLLRGWLFGAAGYIRFLSWVGLVDVLFIFRHNRRCLHDQVAGTKVVRASAVKSPAAGEHADGRF
jgi:uncharacterized RDD family membrane protein YckC